MSKILNQERGSYHSVQTIGFFRSLSTNWIYRYKPALWSHYCKNCPVLRLQKLLARQDNAVASVNLQPPSSRCAVSQFTTIQNFVALKSPDMNRTPGYHRNNSLTLWRRNFLLNFSILCI
jgi:hypothetical protein